MTEQILVLQHNAKAPVGVIGDELRRLGATLKLKNLLAGDSLDGQELDSCHGLIVLGGPISAYNQEYDQQLRETVDIILHFHQRHRPFLGICLGAQLLARAFGQPYRSNNGWETGFTPISLTDTGKEDPLLSDIGELPKVFEFHEDGFYLPDEAELIITGEACTNQGFRIGPFSYGFQFHPEITADITRGWAAVLTAEGAEMLESDLDNLTRSEPHAYLAQAKFAQLWAQRWLALVHTQAQTQAHIPVDEQGREQLDQPATAVTSI